MTDRFRSPSATGPEAFPVKTEPRPLRILINSINYAPELISTGKYAGEMAEWLAARGHQVRVVTCAPHYPDWKTFAGYSAWKFTREKTIPAGHPSQGSLEVFRCPTWIPNNPRGWRRIAYLATYAASTFPLTLAQSGWRPDVVLLVEPTLFCAPHTILLARLARGVAWLHIQDLEVDVAFRLNDLRSSLLDRFAQRVERSLLRHFQRFSTISRPMAQRLAEKGVPESRTTLFPNWVDTSSIRPLSRPSTFRSQLGIHPDAVVALYSGNMGLKQGLGLLAEVCSRLDRRPDVKFVFCGDGPYRADLARLTASLHNVAMLPLQPADRLNELLNLADIHLLPQLEGAADLVMPSKLTGMLASGRPVVATAAHGTELASVLQGRGLVTPPGDPDAFAAALLRLADDPPRRLRLGREGRAYAVAHCGREPILARWERALLESCGVTGRPVADPAPEQTELLPEFEPQPSSAGGSGDD